VVRRVIRPLSVQRRERARLSKPSSFTHVVIELSRNWEVEKMFIAICDGYKIKQVDMSSIISVDGILLNCAIISYMFLE